MTHLIYSYLLNLKFAHKYLLFIFAYCSFMSSYREIYANPSGIYVVMSW